MVGSQGWLVDSGNEGGKWRERGEKYENEKMEGKNLK